MTELESMVSDALRTADRFGYLMPSHLGTRQAEALVERGLATNDDAKHPGWTRLNEDGMRQRSVAMVTLTHIGTDITGRPVYTTLGFWADAFEHAAILVKIHGPITLLWNGIPTPVYPGQTAIEWWIDQNCRADARRSGMWPRQLVAFSGEIDPFKVTLIPVEEEGS